MAGAKDSKLSGGLLGPVHSWWDSALCEKMAYSMERKSVTYASKYHKEFLQSYIIKESRLIVAMYYIWASRTFLLNLAYISVFLAKLLPPLCLRLIRSCKINS